MYFLCVHVNSNDQDDDDNDDDVDDFCSENVYTTEMNKKKKAKKE